MSYLPYGKMVASLTIPALYNPRWPILLLTWDKAASLCQNEVQSWARETLVTLVIWVRDHTPMTSWKRRNNSGGSGRVS